MKRCRDDDVRAAVLSDRDYTLIEICALTGVSPDRVKLMCNFYGLSCPKFGLVERHMFDDIYDVDSEMTHGELTRRYGLHSRDVWRYVDGLGHRTPQGRILRRDLSRVRVCELVEGPEVSMTALRVRRGFIQSELFKSDYCLDDYPELLDRVLDFMEMFGVSSDLIAGIARKCEASFYDVWRASFRLWGGPRVGLRSPRLCRPRLPVEECVVDWYALSDEERDGFEARHAVCPIMAAGQFWMPAVAWYEMGHHGVRGSRRYPALSVRVHYSKFICLPSSPGVRVSPDGAVWVSGKLRTIRVDDRGRRVVGLFGVRVDVLRLVYEMVSGHPLHHRDEISPKNGEWLDCRPSNVLREIDVSLLEKMNNPRI